jgi:hypothetical protein
MTATTPRSEAIPELAFSVVDAARVDYAAAPALRFAVRVESVGGTPIRSILLDAQIQIAARRRRYDASEHERLFELFGPPENWGTSLRTLLWSRTTVVVPPFAGSTVVEVVQPCSYDLEVTASRYFDALADGEVPLEFLFSGSVFAAGADGGLQITRLPWTHEAEYRLPVSVWRDAMDRHFGGTAWLRLRKDTFDRLATYRSRHALASWDDAIEAMLPDG